MKKYCENFSKKFEKFVKEIMVNKRKFFEKYRIFKNKCKILAKKDLILKIQDSFSKWDLSASPIDGLKQNINIDLRMTRRHQTIH